MAGPKYSTRSTWLASSVRTGLQIAGVITVFAVLIVSIYRAGSFIGKPWAGLFYHVCKLFDPTLGPVPMTPESLDYQSSFGGWTALVFFGIAAFVNFVTFGVDAPGAEITWLLFGRGLLSSAIAGLSAMVATVTLVRVLGLAEMK